MFHDRADAAHQLAQELKHRYFRDPLVLAIPRGGVITGAVLAREIGAELDVVLSRKLRAPFQPELAVGAISESGDVYLNQHAEEMGDIPDDYLRAERQHQLAEITRRRKLYWAARPAAAIGGRSVIVTDDGVATGSTMIAALRMIKAHNPFELIVAVPVSPPERLEEIRRICDDVVCLLSPDEFWSVGQFYENFAPVAEDEVIEILREHCAERSKANDGIPSAVSTADGP